MSSATTSRDKSAERCLAIAGVLQALELVQRAAHGKPVDQDAFAASLQSLFALDPATTEDVYGGARGVRDGLSTLVEEFGGGNGRPDVELGRYLVTLLVIQSKLVARSDLLAALRTGLERIERLAAQLGIDHPDVIAALAGLYQETISTLQPRVMVSGDPSRLADPAIAHKIRASLLAALRSVVLWRQLGGSRLKLLLSRRRLVTEARAWLALIGKTSDPA